MELLFTRADEHKRRGVLISASSLTELTQAAYRHTDIKIESIESSPPPWKDENTVYQLATGRYTPRQSLIASENNRLSLKPRAQDMLNIVNSVLDDGKDTLIVTPKAMTAEGTLQHDPLVAKMLSLPNAHVINHYHAEGVNTFDQCERAFIFHFEPNPDTIKHIACSLYRDKTLDFTREVTDFEKNGTRLHQVERYKDARVQLIFDRECEKRIYQALSRVRPELYDGKTIYLFTSEPIAGPVTPILFTLPQAQACIDTHGNLDNFSEFLDTQEARSLEDIATEDNITERTAYRRTETTRKENKAARDAEIIRLHRDGHSTRKIAMHLKVSQGCVLGVLKRHIG